MTMFPIDEISMDLRCDARRACHRKAVFIVRIHNINNCRVTDLTPGGDTVWLMCDADKAALTLRLDAMVGETCATCGRAINQVDDVMTVEKLDG